jgi:iron complex transport system permease protein
MTHEPSQFTESLRPRHYGWIVGGLLVATLLVLLLTPCVGIEWINPLVFGNTPEQALNGQIVWALRVPRMLASFLSGIGLAMSGMAFQALFRSPLASPFTLGVSSGASLGAVLGVMVSSRAAFPAMFLMTPFFALLGALLSIGTVYQLSRLERILSMDRLLLAGVAMNYFCGSGVTLIQYMSNFGNVFHILHTLMGSFNSADYGAVIQLAWFVLPGVVLMACHAEELNLLLLDDEVASSRGIALSVVHKSLFFGVSFITAGIVALFGPIGFVGIVVPHIARCLVGGDHRYLWPVVILLGGMLLTLCDTLSRTVLAPIEIPVGIITAVLGGPFFIVLLRQTAQVR